MSVTIFITIIQIIVLLINKNMVSFSMLLGSGYMAIYGNVKNIQTIIIQNVGFYNFFSFNFLNKCVKIVYNLFFAALFKNNLFFSQKNPKFTIHVTMDF